MVENMILSGQVEDARSVLEQYELIAPNDPDMVSLKGAVLQKPVLFIINSVSHFVFLPFIFVISKVYSYNNI